MVTGSWFLCLDSPHQIYRVLFDSKNGLLYISDMLKLNEDQEIRHLDNLELLARQVVEGFITGLHQSPFHGFSVEFAEHRLYNNGESVKNIDWKLLARTEKLFVKQFEEETNLRCYLLLDTSSSMNFPDKGINKLQYSVYAIASLMYLFKKQRDAFGLCLFSDKIDWISSVKSTSTHLFYLYAELEKMYMHPKKNTTTNITDVQTSTFDLAYYPTEKGPYNFVSSKSDIDANGKLTRPASRWGGLMRAIDQTDFETSNVEFVEFWLQNPFIKLPNSKGGKLFLNFGNVSEDILKDGKRFYENGMNTPTINSAVDSSNTWGKTPVNPIQITQAFSNDPNDRAYQDVGLQAS
jgi:hypothetical protein